MNKLTTTLQGPTGIALLGAVPALPGALVLGGILQGSNAQGVMHDLVQPEYFTSPEPIAIHIASGILFCVLAPLQFSTKLRMRYRKLHRVAGRIAMIAGLLFGLTAVLLMGLPPASADAWLHYAGMTFAGLGVCFSLCMAFLTIRRGDVVRHRQWMRRVIAFGLFDEINRLAYFLDILGFVIRNIDIELFFEFHYQFDGIERIRTQVGNKGGLAGDLFFINSELFGHDIDHAFFNGSHEQSLGDVSKLKMFVL